MKKFTPRFLICNFKSVICNLIKLHHSITLSLIFLTACLTAFPLTSCLYADTITTVAGNGTQGYSGDNGNATSAQLYNPHGVALDSSGNLYIADRENNRIRKVNSSGIITTVAGTGLAGYNGDNISATSADLNYPYGVAIDSSSNLYIADTDNNRIRKVNTSGIITTVAGTGSYGYSGDGGNATFAQLSYPRGVALDSSGNLYIADTWNYRIRKVNTSGIITTVAGTGSSGYSGDGGSATSAQLSGPYGVALDSSSNLFIADTSNNRIRKVNTLGIITTVAGTGSKGYNGDNISATSAGLNYPYGVALDSSSNLFIADTSNNRIRKVNTLGIITTVAGTGSWGYNGDNISATSAQLSGPYGVALDSSCNLYIADTYNNRIRKVLFSGEPNTVTISYATGGEVSITPLTGEMRIQISPFTFTTDITITVTALTTLPVSNQSDVKVINVGFEMTTSRSEQPQKPITITMNYRDMDVFGYDENKLVIGYYDDIAKMWKPEPSQPYPSENKVMCTTNHLSKFALLQVQPAPSSLDNAFCYPSPARLSQGQVINFKGFTSFAEVKILSPAGHILKTLKADQNGNIPPWDGQTDSSGKIASGVYVVHASDEKENLKIFKIMIIK